MRFNRCCSFRQLGRKCCDQDTSDEYHRTSIMAMVSLVKKRPLSLSRHLSAVVEAVIKSLDPSKPLLRKACLQASTKALHELVKRFPVVAFHQRSQRFAVGTSGKLIIIYDLRTATKWRLRRAPRHHICFGIRARWEFVGIVFPRGKVCQNVASWLQRVDG